MEITRWTKKEDLPEHLSLEEFRVWMNMSRSLAYELARRGEIPVIRFGRRIFMQTRKLVEAA